VHHSGPVRLAKPSPWRTSTANLSPVSRRTRPPHQWWYPIKVVSLLLGFYRTGLIDIEPSLWHQNTDIESCRPETGAENAPDGAEHLVRAAEETRQRRGNARESRSNFAKPEIGIRDRTGWLRRQSGSNRSPSGNSRMAAKTGKFAGLFPKLNRRRPDSARDLNGLKANSRRARNGNSFGPRREFQ
jgi:hypothetical protein